eukprot:11378329-Alexandrium_andersonii.AAC.1
MGLGSAHLAFVARCRVHKWRAAQAGWARATRQRAQKLVAAQRNLQDAHELRFQWLALQLRPKGVPYRDYLYFAQREHEAQADIVLLARRVAQLRSHLDYCAAVLPHIRDQLRYVYRGARRLQVRARRSIAKRRRRELAQAIADLDI